MLGGIAESPAPVLAGGSGSSALELAEDPPADSAADTVDLAAVAPVLVTLPVSVGGPLIAITVFPVEPVLVPLAPPTGPV